MTGRSTRPRRRRSISGLRESTTRAEPRSTEGELETQRVRQQPGTSLELTDTMPLGEYRVTFRERNGGSHIGDATLLTPRGVQAAGVQGRGEHAGADGHKQAFRLGDRGRGRDRVGVLLRRPVADANVEVLVYQNPFYRLVAPAARVRLVLRRHRSAQQSGTTRAAARSSSARPSRPTPRARRR